MVVLLDILEVAKTCFYKWQLSIFLHNLEDLKILNRNNKLFIVKENNSLIILM